MSHGARPRTASLTDASTGASHVRVTLVIPTLNEAANLPYVLPEVPSIVDEVVIVDGGSRDGTVDLAREFLPDARIVVERRPGKGRALRRGFEEASGQIIAMMDADGSMDPGELPTLVAMLLGGADVAKGSRFLQGGGTSDMETVRRLGNHALRSVVRLAFGGRYSDLCYGYMAFWRHVLPVFDGAGDGFEVETFFNVRALAAGLHIAEAPSFERRRLHGESHLHTFRDGFRVLRTIARERQALKSSRRGTGVARPVPVGAVQAGVALALAQPTPHLASGALVPTSSPPTLTPNVVPGPVNGNGNGAGAHSGSVPAPMTANGNGRARGA